LTAKEIGQRKNLKFQRYKSY